MTTLETIILAIVEGLTEFLPVSSTGHMIITQNLLNMESTPFVKAFTVIIQFGAILSVVVLYWKRFFRLNTTPPPAGSSRYEAFRHKWDFYYKLLIAFLPAAVIGFLANKLIDRLLGSVLVVATMLVVGGIFMLFCDRLFNKGDEKNEPFRRQSFEDRLLSVSGHDSGSIPFHGYHCGRNGTRAYSEEGGGILFLPRSAHHVCCNLLGFV